MAQIQSVFERYEKKYLLDWAQYQALYPLLCDKMQPDDYGKHTICNLYYDTDQFTLIRASIEKPIYKEKLRLRSYGIPQADSTVFLELKKKFRGVVYKRRVPLTLEESGRYLATGQRPFPNQILSEIDWFRSRYPVAAKAFIAYDRVALFGRENPSLRVTFDTGIRWRGDSLDLNKGDWGSPILDRGTTLMEVKLPGAMPLWMCRLFDSLALYPTSFSKYGVCYQNHLQKVMTGGMICA